MNVTEISPAISFTIISGMFICIVFTILSFYQALLRLPVSNGYRMRTISILSIVLVSWAALAIILAANDFFVNQSASKFQFPNIVYIFIPIILGVIVLNYSNSIKLIVDAIPLHLLIGVQFMRTLGAIFLILYSQSLLPGQFALPAGIGDILVGITAPLVAYLYYVRKQQSKNIVLAWNIAGTLDLVLALTFGFLTSPSPIQLFALDNPNRMIGAFPLVLVPAFAVPLFILYHIFTFRKLKAIK